MIVPDTNLLLYAVNGDSPHHEAARLWWEEVLQGDRPVGLAWVVVLAFLRLSTSRSVFPAPLKPDQAVGQVDSWLACPGVRALAEGPQHWGVLRSLIQATGTAGNLTTDAHLAAVAIENAATLASADNDFRRFPGLDYVNPLQR